MISSMSGKDMSALFSDVVNCMQTDNIGLKKLVYSYLRIYAKSNPDLAIMAVNIFIKVFIDYLFIYLVMNLYPNYFIIYFLFILRTVRIQVH